MKKKYVCQTRNLQVVIDVKKQIWLPNVNSLWIAVKINRHLKKKINKILPNKEYIRDCRCERTSVAYKCKIIEAVSLTHSGHYTCVCAVFKVIGIHTENKICFSKQGIHKWLLLIKNKYGCKMHSTYAYYCRAKSVLAYLLRITVQFGKIFQYCIRLLLFLGSLSPHYRCYQNR